MADDIRNGSDAETEDIKNAETASKEEEGKTPEDMSGEAAEEKAEEAVEDQAREAETDNTEEAAADQAEETPEDTDAAAEAGKEEDSKKKKGIFGRKKEKPDRKDEMIADLKDKLTRQMAEFDNYRKRTEKEKAANFIIGAKDVLEKILPVIDNFERGLADADPKDPFAEGMNMIYKQLIGVLSDMGVTHIEAVGKPFDPELHNAVMHVEDENLGENIVAEEFQKGYMYKDQVLRHSMVKVAN